MSGVKRKPRDLAGEVDALRARLEDLEDAVRARTILAETRLEDCLPVEVVERKLAGEHPVRIWREQRGMTASGLAKKAGMPPSYLSEIENGKKPGSTAALKSLAAALGVRIDDLVS